MSGKGILKWKNGNYYIGDWHENNSHGKGEEKFIYSFTLVTISTRREIEFLQAEPVLSDTGSLKLPLAIYLPHIEKVEVKCRVRV